MNITEKQPHSAAYLSQRRFLFVVPLIILPFVLLGFKLLGGGNGTQTQNTVKVKGINTTLPSAMNEADTTMDKMAFYDQSRQDSLKKAGSYQDDPYNKLDTSGNHYGTDPAAGTNFNRLQGSSRPADPSEVRLQQKLAELNAAINANSTNTGPPADAPATSGSSASNKADIDRLQAMMTSMQSSGSGDPEMTQISNMLNQVMDITQPGRAQSRLREASARSRGQVFGVSTTFRRDPVTLLDNQAPGTATKGGNGFFSLNEKPSIPALQNTIEAATCESQTLVSGAIIKLKLLNDVYVNGQLIPRNTFVYGTVNLSGERMMVNVTSLRYGNGLYPVSLSVCDLDGLDGIHIPGAIGRDVAKEASGDALQGIGLSSMDPSISMQAMDAGIQAAKSFIGKKIRLIKVCVKAGYHILLKDEKQKD
ncbi:Bacteroides conjugative transposon TraM protein [Mucilaginibacter pineti]|uniref:Bacteroides conjugative transposon TraM protein n=1 Tax=Mucilaginibacter pineti TaxID=1391627 RepID=A0A1G7INX1_9SPHI|nr:conjugative transposon protein TraM [Mucilaginibacter pineti]SDF14452.1 Bacteroides conjugative transposon TraM protein [Mucilaginibacter pineti]